MKRLRLGELCAGYGGLGMAVEDVFNADTAWFSEFDAAPSKILKHHWPHVPNYGDMTKIDWADIEPVDIISGGTPCQDLSHAGRRAGMTEGTRSNLWVQMREAIAIQRPRYVVWENVRGAYSATAASDLEQCPRCMGDTGDGGTVLRALGRVLGDLSDLGLHAEWRGLRAADVGACHGRFRVFVLAYDPSRIGRPEALQHHGCNPANDDRAGVPDQSDSHTLRLGPLGEAAAHRDNLGINGCRQRPEQNRWGQSTNGRLSVPDTSGRRFNGGQDLQGERRDASFGSEEVDHAGDSNPPRRDLATEPQGFGGREGWAEHARLEGGLDAFERSPSTNWGDYAPAIARWESVMGRRAPAPTEPTGRNGGHRLSPRFTEWMMGLPDGWVTDPAIGISRNEQLKACGNGVVPQQAMAALRDMLSALVAA